jgi:opacity protein-like surface antigen
MKRNLATICLLATTVPMSAQAQDWEYTATLSGWFSGIGTEVDTRFGTLETELSFADVWDNLDMAFFGSFEARQGRWSLIGDLVYADLGTERATPFGQAFRSAEVQVKATLLSGYATYNVLDTSVQKLDLGAGFRFNDVSVDVQLNGNLLPSTSQLSSDNWVDPLLAARFQHDFSDKWFAVGFADVGGFGIGDASNLTWQAYGGIGYRFNETWSAQAGYRYLSIDRDFGGRNITLDMSGPIIGVQATF